MFKKYYQRQLPGGSKTAIDLSELKNLYYAELSIDRPYDFKALAEQRGLANLQRALEDFCSTHFRYLDVDVDAVHTLYERYPQEPNRRQVIEQFVRNGTAWLRPSHRAQVEQNIRANYDDDVQLGLHQPAGVVHAYYEELQGSILGLAKAAGFRSAVNNPVDVGRDAIYFYSELAGIPLVYIDGIEDYKKVYQDLAYHGRELHIDSREEQFPDIVIQEGDEIAQTIRVNRVLFVGSILRVIELSAAEGQPMQYSYMERSGAQPVRRPLGSLYSAMKTLQGNEELLRRIEDEVRDRRRTLRYPTRLRFLTTLMYHVADGSHAGIQRGPYPPEYVEAGGTMVERLSPEFRAINEVINEETGFLAGEIVDPEINNREEEARKRALAEYTTLGTFSEERIVGTRAHRILLTSASNSNFGLRESRRVANRLRLG